MAAKKTRKSRRRSREAIAKQKATIAKKRNARSNGPVVDGFAAPIVEPTLPTLIAAIAKVDDLGKELRALRDAHRKAFGP